MKWFKYVILIVLMSMLIVSCGADSKYYKEGEKPKDTDMMLSSVGYSLEDKAKFSKELTGEEFETIYKRFIEQVSLRKGKEDYTKNPKALLEDVAKERKDIILEGIDISEETMDEVIECLDVSLYNNNFSYSEWGYIINYGIPEENPMLHLSYMGTWRELETKDLTEEDYNKIMSKIAEILGKRKDLKEYKEKPEELLQQILEENDEEVFQGIEISAEEKKLFLEKVVLIFLQDSQESTEDYRIVTKEGVFIIFYSPLMEDLDENPMSKEDVELILERVGKYIEEREDIDTYREKPRDLLDMALEDYGEEIFEGIMIDEGRKAHFDSRISISFIEG